jgi:hypothetical protein
MASLDPIPTGPPPPDDPEVPPAIEALDLASPGPPQFEFTTAQEHLIRDLAVRMRIVGLFFIAIAIAPVLIELLATRQLRVVNLALLIYLLIGIWTRSAAASFQAVIETKGKDITHVMEALESLKSMYGLISGLLIAGLVLLGLIFLWGVFGKAIAIGIA